MPQPRLDWTEAEFEFNFKFALGDGVICWSPNDGQDRWKVKTVQNIVDGGWHGDKRLVLTADNTSKIARRH